MPSLPHPALLRPVALIAAALAAGAGLAQYYQAGGSGSYSRLEGGGYVNVDTVKTARETLSHSITLPAWTNPEGFERDVFTFTRVIFNSDKRFGEGIGRGRTLGWWVDYPDADLNLSYRLRQMTSIAVDPDARVMKLTNPELTDHPFLFMVHVEGISLDDEEVAALRNHLLLGGSLFVTDSWGDDAWNHFRRQMRQVFPGREWTELGMEHPLFQAVFTLEGPMHRLRVPTMQFWNTASDADDPDSYLQHRHRGEGSEVMRVQALHDDHGRIMVVVAHNSDISDGWEREGENEDYFKTYSEPRAYPLAINIIFYLMTH